MQPTGKPHLGNYLGAMKQHITLQETNECFYFLADYHALTTVKDPNKLRELTRELAMDYLALGLDPEKVAFFRQSDVPEHVELTWILSCLTSYGLLNRAHAWKDAQDKGKKDTTVGLFIYPVLMAADILIYKPDMVPVGQDQKQHVEICRDMASTFNSTYGETFPLPEPEIRKEVAVVPGTDGQKMSKSYSNTIEIFADEGALKKQIMGIVTDSKGVDEPKDPDNVILQLFRFFGSTSDVQMMDEAFASGGMGYGDAKKKLLEAILEYFGSARKKRIELGKDLGYVDEVLQKGAAKARKVATKTIEEVREKVGLK